MKFLLRGFIALLVAITLLFSAQNNSPVFAQTTNDDCYEDFATEGVTNDLLGCTNPLNITGSDQAETLSTPGGIISRVLLFAFPIAGLILFVMILWGGFETIMQSAGKKSVEAGRQRITAAVIGFVLLFVSIWIIRVIETVFGIKVLFF
jgi:hypothetical protein